MIRVDDRENFMFSSHSWTFFHWSLVEQLAEGTIDPANICERVLEELLYCIFPGGNTVLHYLVKNPAAMKYILDKAHNNGKSINWFVPILPNFKGETALHICEKGSDYQTMNMLLNNLSLYGIDHHSRMIKDLYPVFISKQLPSFIPYLETRFISSTQSALFTKANIKGGKDLGMIASDLFYDTTEVKNQMTEVSDAIEASVVAKFVDMPGVYHYLDKDFVPLFEELSTTENYEYFATSALKNLIDFNYPLVKKFIIIRLFLPFVCFITYFCYFIHFIYPLRFSKEIYHYYGIDYASMVILPIFALYFLNNEFKQVMGEGLSYFGSMWNYIDIIPSIGVLFITFFFISDYSMDEDLKS